MTDHDELGCLEQMLDTQWLREDATGDDEIDAALSEMGIEPEALERQGARLGRRAQMGALDWRAKARARMNRRAQMLEMSEREPRPQLKRGELLEAIERARATSCDRADHIATYFRSRTPEVASNEELQGLLQDLELLHALRREEE